MLLAVIVIGIIVSIFCSKSIRYLGLGIVVNLVYILFIGADYMQGRFFTFAYLLAVLILVQALVRVKLLDKTRDNLIALTCLFLLTYSLTYSVTPLKTDADYFVQGMTNGIENERGMFFRHGSIWVYLNGKKIFPDFAFSKEGKRFSESSETYILNPVIGCFGFQAGTKKIIIDPLGLSDPLLARLPSRYTENWRVGHYPRVVPAGYKESLLSAEALIENPKINEYYKKIKIVTQDDLWTFDRLKTIIALNLGLYTHLLK